MHELSGSDYTIALILTLVIGFLISYYSAKYAQRKGRDPYLWFALVIFFGLLALFILFLLPPVKKEEPPAEVVPPSPPSWESTLTLQQWHCITTLGDQQGPLPFAALKKLWTEGKIDARSFVWSEKLVTWRRVEEIPELLKALAN